MTTNAYHVHNHLNCVTKVRRNVLGAYGSRTDFVEERIILRLRDASPQAAPTLLRIPADVFLSYFSTPTTLSLDRAETPRFI